MAFPELPTNPAELAETRAQESTGQDFDVSLSDHHLLAELEHGAEELGFIDQKYFVEASRALVIPASFEADKNVSFHSFFGLTFEGSFNTYNKVHIGKIIGAGAVRAVCLAFPKATLLPYFDELDSQDILYVPALAVTSMQAA